MLIGSLAVARGTPAPHKRIKVTSDLLVRPSAVPGHPTHHAQTPPEPLADFSRRMAEKTRKGAARELVDLGVRVASSDRELLTQLDLPDHTFDFFEGLKDEGLRVQADELKAFMRQLGPAVGGKKDDGKGYEDYLKMAQKKLLKMRKAQVKRYEEWRKESWDHIVKYLEAGQRIFDADDALNISENEKYYQLFLVEDGEKRAHLLPFIDLENRLLNIIESELEGLTDEKMLEKASLRQTTRLSNRMERRARRASQRARRDYVRGVRALDRQYMGAWKRNEAFVGDDA